MKWFDSFVSNTLGGTGNQLFFKMDDSSPVTGRVYYKVFCGGKFPYSLLFSNIIDSTYNSDFGSSCNMLCNKWEILNLAIGVCKSVSPEEAGEVKNFTLLTFGGNETKTVMPGEFFTTDPVEIEAAKGDYLCCEITFNGTMMPYHRESLLPTFTLENGKWVPNKLVPVPGMVGCERKVKLKIGYFGDSITQGIGTTPNAYTHWNALVSEALGEDYAFWNLGLGYGKGQDAASDGAWLFKAMQMDAIVLCFGTNDVGRGRSTNDIKNDLAFIVRKLKAAGVKVFLQSMPPFSWEYENLTKWLAVNRYLTDELSQEADGFLDVAPLLTVQPVECGLSKYGKHPDEEGCRIWAEALIPLMKEFISNQTKG